MKAVFLDVDGVLNDGKETGEISEEYVEKLADVCKKFDADVVLYSKSKYGFDQNLNPKNEESKHLIEALEERDVNLYKTPNIITKDDVRKKRINLVRPAEIISFLVKNKVQKYSIISNEKVQDKTLSQNQIVCEDGLDDEIVEEISKIMS